ncbi:MAG: hypothetical protein U0271_09430 [Polyangiaceae bacterium]
MRVLDWVIAIATLASMGCGDDGSQGGGGAGGSPISGGAGGLGTGGDGGASVESRVLVSVALHLEPSTAYSQCAVAGYYGTRDRLVEFVKATSALGATLNIQSDNTFLEGIRDCEATATHTNTDGMSLGDWLAAQSGVEFDAHKEGGNELNGTGTGPDDFLYADVHALLDADVPNPSDVVGGLIWQDANQLARLEDPAGATGVDPASPPWFPAILSLAVGTNHHLGNFDDDDFSSGVWRPKGANADFTTDDPAKLPYVGPGLQHTDWGNTCPYGFHDARDYIPVILTMVDEGSAAPGLYTATLALPEDTLKLGDPAGRWAHAIEIIEGVNELAAADARIQWANYSTVVETWQTEFASSPTRVALTDIPAERWTCAP